MEIVYICGVENGVNQETQHCCRLEVRQHRRWTILVHLRMRAALNDDAAVVLDYTSVRSLRKRLLAD
jgi:hypothetical protein